LRLEISIEFICITIYPPVLLFIITYIISQNLSRLHNLPPAEQGLNSIFHKHIRLREKLTDYHRNFRLRLCLKEILK